MTFSQYLQSLTIKQFISAKQHPSVVSCLSQDPIPQVMEKLCAHRILSIPVYHDITREFLGSIGLTEIIKLITDLHWKLLDTPKPNRQAAIYVEFNNTLVSDIMVPKSIKVHETADFRLAVQTMIQADLYRLPVVDGSGKVIHIISYTDILQVILKGLVEVSPVAVASEKKVKQLSHIANLLAALEKTGSSTDDLFLSSAQLRKDDTKLAELIYESNPRDAVVSTVNAKAKAIEAFRVLLGSNLSAVPIVDDHYTLLSTISIRDIRRIAMNAEHVSVLYEEDAMTFSQRVFEKGLSEDDIALASQTQGSEKSVLPRHSIASLTVTFDDTLTTVVKKLNENRIFRVWVVDDKKRPVGVVTVKDVIHELIS